MSTITTINSGDLISDSRTVINTNFSNLNNDKVETSAIDTSTDLDGSSASDSKVPSQLAVKTYVDTQLGSSSVLSKVKFGGSGADGALSVTSGTTTVNLGGARVVVKNYTSISITGTGALAFSNPHASGTIIVLKSQGDVVITSTANPAISAVGMGANGGAGGTSGAGAVAGTNGSVPQPMIVSGLTGGGLGASSSGGGTAGSAGSVSSPTISTTFGIAARHLPILIGSGGGGGGYGSNNSIGGDGGKGGGCLIIQCSGSYTCTGIVSAAGAAGSAATEGSPTPNQSAGGGGGGAGGSLIVLYNTLTSDSGTYTISGGSGGAGGTAGGAGTGGGGGGGGGSNTAGSAGTAGDGSGNGGAGGAGGDGVSLVALNTEFA